MSWFRKNPFSSQEEAAHHMVELLAKEAENAGTPLSDHDKEILLQDDHDDFHDRNPLLPDELRQKAKDLIRKIYELETSDEHYWDPRSFGNSLEWAGDTYYPNIVALAEEVSCDMAGTANPPLHGWRLVKDRLLLVGCGLLVFVLMIVIGITINSFFPNK